MVCPFENEPPSLEGRADDGPFDVLQFLREGGDEDQFLEDRDLDILFPEDEVNNTGNGNHGNGNHGNGNHGHEYFTADVVSGNNFPDPDVLGSMTEIQIGHHLGRFCGFISWIIELATLNLNYNPDYDLPGEIQEWFERRLGVTTIGYHGYLENWQEQITDPDYINNILIWSGEEIMRVSTIFIDNTSEAYPEFLSEYGLVVNAYNELPGIEDEDDVEEMSADA
jgi:hypothetical protein